MTLTGDPRNDALNIGRHPAQTGKAEPIEYGDVPCHYCEVPRTLHVDRGHPFERRGDHICADGPDFDPRCPTCRAEVREVNAMWASGARR